jgi:AraC family transcriptional regulator
MELLSHGSRKYPTSALLRSSAGLGWATISAELRSHGVGDTRVIVPQDVELSIKIEGNDDGLVIRTGAGQIQRSVPATGTICLSPIGVANNALTITAPVPKTMHLYLSTRLFRRLSDDFNLPNSPAHAVRYICGFKDEVIRQAGLSILAEMTHETAAGRMYVETAAMMLAARIVNLYGDSEHGHPTTPTEHHRDHARMRQVLDYIHLHVADDTTLGELARIAGLSAFHFARTFTSTIGISPHRYIGRLRLEKAMAEIAAGKLPLSQIALDARFSSQATFTRAFRRATGMTPGEYRNRRR